MKKKNIYKYKYKEGETPEERLRNKIQLLFFLIKLGANKDSIFDIDNLFKDINNLLDDIPLFYKNSKNQ